MKHLLSELRRLFGSGPMPDASALVRWDGFDQLEKKADDDFVSQLFHQLYRLIFMHKGSPFTAAQTSLLASIARDLPIYAVERDVDCLIDDYVVHNIERYLQERARGS